jgi:aromatic ring-cleaving dioxygenase
MRGFFILGDNVDFKVNSKLLPKDFPREFDAHIYFQVDQLNEATILRDKIKEHFKNNVFFVGDMIPVPIGPHPLPMFEANFPVTLFEEVKEWLTIERGDFSILLHSLKGDDYLDHTEGAEWLGASLQLKLNVF